MLAAYEDNKRVYMYALSRGYLRILSLIELTIIFIISCRLLSATAFPFVIVKKEF